MLNQRKHSLTSVVLNVLLFYPQYALIRSLLVSREILMLKEKFPRMSWAK